MKKNIIPGELISGIGQSSPMESDLMYYVPDGVTGITACNSGIQRMKEYWSAPTMISLREILTDPARLNGLVAPFLPEAEKLKSEEITKKAASIIKAVLDSQSVKAGTLFSEYVQYQYNDGKALLPVSTAIGSVTEEINYKPDFDALKNAGVPVTEEVVDGFTFYVFDYNAVFKSMNTLTQGADFKLPELKMYFSFSGKKFGAGNNKEAIIKFFKEEKLPKKPSLFEEQQFKTAMSDLSFDSSRDFCQSYMDFKGMIISSLSSAGSSAGSGVETPEMKKILDSFPVTHIAQSFGYKGALVVTQEWGIKDSALPEEAKIWIEAFKTSKSFDGISLLPANIAIGSAVNGEIFEKLKSAAEKTAQLAPLMSGIPYLDFAIGAQNISMSVLPPSSGVIWPESMVSIKLAKSKELYVLAKEQILKNASQGGLANFKWLEKQVDGNKIDYFNTPLGLGLYLSEKDNTFTLASSEATLSTAFAVKEGKSDGMNLKIKKMGISRDTAGLSEGFMSFPALLSIARTVQSSIAMFVPMNFQISKDYDVIANALGEYYFSAKLNNGHVKFIIAQKPL